ncbi:MAG: phosphopantetheine-binding protein [Pseudomonadota bacterium]
MSTLEYEVKDLIIKSLELEDILPEAIVTEAPLFTDEGLGLDSIDALELGVALKKRYGIKLETNDTSNREHFYSVATLVRFIENYKKEI